MADLRDLLAKLSEDDSVEIKSAVEKTRNFVRLTSLQLQTKSDGAITVADIQKILEDPAKGLEELRAIQGDDAQVKRANEILDTCSKAIKNQLELLYEFNNSIGKYYKSNPTALKEQVEGKRHRPK